MHLLRFGRVCTALATFVVFCSPPAAHAAISKQEAKCSATISKAYSKLQATILKETSKCRGADISERTDHPTACDPLPASAQDKIDAAKEKFIASVAKSCQSVCGTSNDKACVSDLSCPPNGAIAERCTGKGGTNPFRVANLGFPGPYCTSVLGHEIADTRDLGECLATLVDSTASPLVDAIYADIDENTGLDSDAQKCLSTISKTMTKSVGKAFLAVAKCRDAQKTASSPAIDEHLCDTDDPATVSAIAKEVAALDSAIAKSCTDTSVGALVGLCAAGGGAPATVAEAQACLEDVLIELATAERGRHRHVYSRIGMINVVFPDSAYPYCGDGLVETDREERTGVGEECDGSDAPCGGGTCLPPGDLFECTCDNTVRERLVIDGERVDSDAGWTGDSHDATHNDGFGYVAELSNCDCSEVTQATCTGSTTDPVCDVLSIMAPRCSDDLFGSETCDQRGNNNGLPEDRDCFVCDANSLNAGTYCADGGDPDEDICESQCFDDATGTPLATPCDRQSDCGAGQTCRGRCDNTVTCNTMTEGSPLPLVSAAVPVCISNQFVTDVTGTKNIVTGETVVNYHTRNIIQLGDFATQPCPVCGGVCEGGDSAGDSCYGRCDASDAPCLLDADCVGPGDTRCLETDDDCAGGSCSLDLRCSSGDDEGDLCSPSAVTPLGVVSSDCGPNSAINLSGTGVQQPFGDITTEVVEHPAGGPCSNPAWSNYDCPCPDGGGAVQTQPNNCAAACNAGPNAGQGCAVAGNGQGVFTVCVGGSEAGAACDEDTDCTGGTCSGNPKECTAGHAGLLGQFCTVNANCDTTLGSGDGVCSDACPGGRCVPLCYPEGECDGGTRDGQQCATDADCTGGGTCLVTDDEDGLCAAGPDKFRCSGAGYTTLPCSQLDVGTQKGCETGDDGVAGNEDDIPGAGLCQSRPIDCWYNNGLAEGGDTLNGGGSPSEVNVNATFCTPPNGNSAIDSVSGFGGPSRIRREGAAFINVPSFP